MKFRLDRFGSIDEAHFVYQQPVRFGAGNAVPLMGEFRISYPPRPLKTERRPRLSK